MHFLTRVSRTTRITTCKPLDCDARSENNKTHPSRMYRIISFVSRHPFLYLSLYSSAVQLVLLPLPEFHRLAALAGDPAVPVCACAMTARCGSTLLAQMANRADGVRALSESMATVNVYQQLRAGNIT